MINISLGMLGKMLEGDALLTPLPHPRDVVNSPSGNLLCWKENVFLTSFLKARNKIFPPSHTFEGFQVLRDLFSMHVRPLTLSPLVEKAPSLKALHIVYRVP